jgi:crossover junction endodeoxyribonuclease RuvC
MMKAMNRTGTSSYRILGIDPGLNITGYGIIEIASGDPRIVEAGALRTNPKSDIAERIFQLHADLTDLLKEFKPDTAAMENLYAHYKHPRTSILMGHARGALLLACRQENVSVRNIASTEVKKSLTGNGHASKQQVQRSIQAVFQLPQTPSPPDVADALAIALCAGKYI